MHQNFGNKFPNQNSWSQQISKLQKEIEEKNKIIYMISAENKKNKQLIEKSNLTIQNLQEENDQLKNDIKNVNSLKNQI